MVKTTNSNIRNSGLDAIVEQLKINNKQSLKQTEAINTLISDNQSARADEKRALVAERAVDQRKESLARKSRLEALRERKPTGMVGSFTRGAIGGTAYGALGAGLGGLGIGGGIGALLRGGAGLAGRGLLFGGLVAATNSMIQGMLDRTFDNIKPEDIGFKDEERAKEKITGGMNAAIALKFLGARGRTALLTGIGLAFSDQITDFISNRLGTDRLTAPDWMQKTFGLTEDQLTINLNDGKVAAAVSAAVSLVAGQIIFWGTKKAGAGVKNLILGKPNNPETLKNQRGFNPNKKPPVVSTNTPVLKSPSSSAVNVAENLDDAIVQNRNSPRLLNQFGNPISPSVDIDAPKIKSKRLTATNFDEIKSKQDFKKRVLKAEARYKTKMATSNRIKTLFNQIQNNTKLRKGISVGGKALGAGTLAFSGTMGYLDEERKKAGQTGTQRVVGGIVEDAASTVDMLVDGMNMLPNMLANTLISPFTDFRFKTKNITGGLAGDTARKGTFFLFEEMNELNKNLKSSENLIRDLGYGGYFNGMNTPPPVIIDNSSGGNTTMGTNNFSMESNPLGFVNPYAEAVR